MGHVVWQTSYYLWFPDVHMKEQCWLLCPGDWSLYYPLRKGLTFNSGSMKWTPHLDAKHFARYSNLRTILISSTSTSEQVSFFIKQYFRVPAQRGRGHFRRLHISMLKIILSFINSGHPSNQTSMSSSDTWSSVSTAAQLGRSIKIGGSQSNLRNQRNAALKTPWRSQ